MCNCFKKKKFNVKIPEFIEKGTHGQLTTMQANKSRLVTKMRFAIETANGRMKSKWSLFQKIIPSILTKNLMPDYRIGAALLNVFGKPIHCENGNVHIASLMKNLVDTKNDLVRVINSKNFKKTRKRNFGTLEGELHFPKLDLDEMKNISLGIYAMKQAISYAAEHVKIHGYFKISILPSEFVDTHFGRICSKKKIDAPIFISAAIKSRYRGSKMHNAYILYDAVEKQKILHYCECQHGQRTVGCCSHIMAIIFYFGFSRYYDAKDPASHLNDFFEMN